jgi:phosphatidylethanolamine/phosphatidyl-N-methylethanolamine N-methyltransferase
MKLYPAGVVELVDAPDSKSGELRLVRVRVSPPAPSLPQALWRLQTMPIGETNPFRIIGTFAPSSNHLADAMTRTLPGERILEVGAGTGAITKTLLKKMKPSQQIWVVEYYEKLTAMLRMRFRNEPSITFHSGDILHFDGVADSYDTIICSLPFNAFLPETTEAILEKMITLARDGAIMSFYEYKVMQGFVKKLLPKKKREHFINSQHLIDLFCQRYKFDEAIVTMNIPPAVVHYLRIDKASSKPLWRAHGV